MSSLLAGTLIILSAIIMTVVKRKMKVRRRMKANDRIIKKIVDRLEREYDNRNWYDHLYSYTHNHITPDQYTDH